MLEAARWGAGGLNARPGSQMYQTAAPAISVSNLSSGMPRAPHVRSDGSAASLIPTGYGAVPIRAGSARIARLVVLWWWHGVLVGWLWYLLGSPLAVFHR